MRMGFPAHDIDVITMDTMLRDLPYIGMYIRRRIEVSFGRRSADNSEDDDMESDEDAGYVCVRQLVERTSGMDMATMNQFLSDIAQNARAYQCVNGYTIPAVNRYAFNTLRNVLEAAIQEWPNIVKLRVQQLPPEIT